MNYYEGNIVPEKDTIFVFGSNPQGRHGAGSARVAVKQFNAKYGQGEGLQGDAYGLVTTELRPWMREKGDYSLSRETIIGNIKKMYDCANEHPDKKFKVAYRNSPSERTLCGYSGRELMEMFKEAAKEDGYPNNIYFSKEWVDSGLLEF